jgi:predicted Fe-S protein YdhL (DUF1289 family)
MKYKLNELRSPCVGHCGLNNENVCVGCGRTTKDIRNWIGASDEEKKQIISESRERLRVQKLRDDNLYND